MSQGFAVNGLCVRAQGHALKLHPHGAETATMQPRKGAA